MSQTRARSWQWSIVAVAAAFFSIHGGFSATRIFYLRDLALEYWPRHLWLRKTILSGQSPLWEPHIAFGQSAIADPTHQLLFIPTMLLRLLLPTVVGFNLWIGLPFPLAALGIYLFLCRHVTRPAAALGAATYVLSGPVLSTGNMPNLSWSVMFIPWILWALDRLADRRTILRTAVLAVFFALQLLAGEPVTFAASAALAIIYAAMATPAASGDWRTRATLALLVLGAELLGLLLAAGQVLPLLEATNRSLRVTQLQANYFGTLHPLTLFDAIAPKFWGDFLADILTKENSPWLLRLNGGRDPLFTSIYIGIGALSLSLFGTTTSRRRRWVIFWFGIFLFSLACALGEYTPLYPALQKLFPPLRSFRYPVKYTVITALSAATLVAEGWEALNQFRRSESTRRAISGLPVILALAVAALSAAFLIFALLFPNGLRHILFRLAVIVGLDDPAQGVTAIIGTVPLVLLRLAILSGGAGLCLWLGKSARREARLGRGVLFGMILLDLCLMNSGLNPTINAALIGEPKWVAATRAHPYDRVYIGPKITGTKLYPNLAEEGFTLKEASAVIPAQLAYFPGAWDIYEGLSTDVNVLWPREYDSMLRQFLQSDVEESARFLQRTGTRYYITRTPPPGASPEPISHLEHNPTWGLYEGLPPAPRAALVQETIIEPDTSRAMARLFASDFDPSAEVIIGHGTPSPAGRPGSPAGPSVEITAYHPTDVEMHAQVPLSGAYLVLMDSYDPNWRVEVDGAPAVTLRADGLFRAVRLASGEHSVRFTYRPWSLTVGLALSGGTALILLTGCLYRRKGSHRDGNRSQSPDSEKPVRV